MRQGQAVANEMRCQEYLTSSSALFNFSKLSTNDPRFHIQVRSSGPALDRYIQKVIKKYRTPSAQEEQVLLRIAQSKGQLAEEARQTLILSHQRFVLRMAFSDEFKGVSPFRLLQQGNLGLVEAIDRYDFNKKNKDGSSLRLLTFAKWWLAKYMREEVNREQMLYLSQARITQRKKIYDVSLELRRRWGRNATELELYDEVRRKFTGSKNQIERPLVHFSNYDFYELMSTENIVSSLDEPIKSNSNQTLLDLVSEDQALFYQPPKISEQQQVEAWVRDLLETAIDEANLTSLEEQAIESLYGLNGQPQLGKVELAEKMKITGPGLSDRIEAALQKIKKTFLRNSELSGELDLLNFKSRTNAFD